MDGPVFKIVKDVDNVDFHNFFQLSTTGLRGHSHKIFKPFFKHDVGKYTFSNRVIDSCNRLPENIIDCESLDNFKEKLDRLFKFYCGVNISLTYSFLPGCLSDILASC